MRAPVLAIVLSVPALVLLAAEPVRAQTVRFQTSVGSFDMVLNPTDDADLQPFVDNILAYVGTGRYHHTAINRAVDGDNDDASDDFVLQMGGFLGFPRDPELFATSFESIDRFDSVTIDANGDGNPDVANPLSNTRGRVSMALSAGDVNSATSEFFVNLGDNNFLDAQGFIPFAEIPDMTTIDTIMSLMQTDLGGSVALADVPLLDNGKIVILERIFVTESDADFSFFGPVAGALGVDFSNAAAASATATTAAASSVAAASSSAVASPEPSGVWLAASALFAFRQRRRR